MPILPPEIEEISVDTLLKMERMQQPVVVSEVVEVSNLLVKDNKYEDTVRKFNENTYHD